MKSSSLKGLSALNIVTVSSEIWFVFDRNEERICLNGVVFELTVIQLLHKATAVLSSW